METGYFFGVSGTTHFFSFVSALNFNLAAGKHIKDNAILSGAIGLEKNRDGTLYPFTANFKRYFGDNSNQYASLQIGYAFGNGDSQNPGFEYQGGVAAGISYGLNLFRIKNAKIYSQIGYKLRRSTISFESFDGNSSCLLYTSPSPRDATLSRMPSSA